MVAFLLKLLGFAKDKNKFGFIKISYDDYWKVINFNIPALIQRKDTLVQCKTLDGNFYTLQPEGIEDDDKYNKWSSVVEYYLENEKKFLNLKLNGDFEFKRNYNLDYFSGSYKEINMSISEMAKIMNDYNDDYRKLTIKTTDICPYCSFKLHIIPKARCKCKNCKNFIRVKYDPDTVSIYQMTTKKAGEIDFKYQKVYDIFHATMGKSYHL